jgi:tetratricopeptide (TPR) repeat protein
MSFATDHSRSFERLSRALLAQQLGIAEEAIVLTQAVKDGGADGFQEFRLGSILDQDLNYSLAFEAKLRSARANPGLDTFAKAMIIAFNARRHGLAVTTNRLFTPQCTQEAATFQMRTGLQFIFVDGPRISQWIRPRLKRLEADGYETAFLHELLWADDSQPIAVPESPPLIPCEGGIPSVRVVVHPEGRDHSERLIGRIVTEPVPQPAPTLPKIHGADRQGVVEGLRLALARGDGLHLLWGEGGVGKSLAVSHVTADRAALGWSVSCINLRTCFTARDLFLKLLSALLGTDILIALAETGAGQGGAFLSELLGQHDEPRNVLDSAASALLAGAHKSDAEAGLDHALLVGLLERVVERRRDANLTCPPALLVVQEATYATSEVSDFLLRAAAALAGPGIAMIVESRPHDLDDRSSRNWEAFRQTFRAGASSEFTFPAFTVQDARRYLTEILPGIGRERADFVIARVGTIPLFLETARDFLRERGAVTTQHGHTTIEDLEVFFEGIRPDQPTVLVRLQVEHWGRHYAALFHTAAMFDGRLTGAAAIAADGAEGAADLDKLVATGLFEPSPSLDGVHARHGLIIDALQVFATDAPFAARSVAERLLPALVELEADPLTRRAREADLRALAGQKEEAVRISSEVGFIFRRQHQLQRAERYLRQAHKLAREVAVHRDDSPVHGEFGVGEALLDLLELQNERHRLASEEATHRLEDARDLWERPDIDFEDGGTELKLRAGFILWRADHLRERFVDAEKMARDLFWKAGQVGAEAAVPDDVVGRALAGLGVTLKALGRIDDSRSAFSDARSICPNSVALLLQMHSNEEALALVSSPEQALVHVEEILAISTRSGLQPLDSLHTLVDRSMVLFLLKRYESACADAVRSERLAGANGIAAQAARARNILGCCRWAAGEDEEAYHHFVRAVLDAERSLSDRFLWRMRTNLASAAFQTDRYEEAAAHASSAARRIVEPRRGVWPRAEDMADKRWYHALIQCGALLAKLSAATEVAELIAKVPNRGFQRDVEAVARGSVPEWMSSGSSIHAGHIMITG